MVSDRNLTATDFAAMTQSERTLRLNRMREAARTDAAYQDAQVKYSTRELREWLAVETRDERQARKANERIERRAADAEADRIHALEAEREARQHELLVIKAWNESNANGNGAGNGADTIPEFLDALIGITDALNALSARMEAVEAQTAENKAVLESVARRFDYVAPTARESAEKAVATTNDTVSGLKNEIAFLRFRIDALVSKRHEPLEQRVIVIPG
jgi:hypothetical protein